MVLNNRVWTLFNFLVKISENFANLLSKSTYFVFQLHFLMKQIALIPYIIHGNTTFKSKFVKANYSKKAILTKKGDRAIINY